MARLSRAYLTDTSVNKFYKLLWKSACFRALFLFTPYNLVTLSPQLVQVIRDYASTDYLFLIFITLFIFKNNKLYLSIFL